MTPENVRKLHVLSRQLAEHLMSAALCAKEIGEITQDPGHDGHDGAPGANNDGRNGEHAMPQPLMDEATLSVIWRGRPLHLGHTKPYWLLARLARRVNQYVTHTDLLREIWDDELADTELLRAGMKRLRRELRHGGMADLAEALIGHHGRYMLDLTRAKCHREVPAVSHRMSEA